MRLPTLRGLLLATFCLLLAAGPVRAISPGEILDDPALEARARSLSKELRCLVCQNQSIDDSEAELARDLRGVVRERLLAGDDDRAVLNHIRARYGDFVLLSPPMQPTTWVLWFAPPVLLGFGGLAVAGFYRSRRRAAAAGAADGTAPIDDQGDAAPLTPAEAARLATLLAGDPSPPPSQPGERPRP